MESYTSSEVEMLYGLFVEKGEDVFADVVHTAATGILENHTDAMAQAAMKGGTEEAKWNFIDKFISVRIGVNDEVYYDTPGVLVFIIYIFDTLNSWCGGKKIEIPKPPSFPAELPYMRRDEMEYELRRVHNGIIADIYSRTIPIDNTEFSGVSDETFVKEADYKYNNASHDWHKYAE